MRTTAVILIFIYACIVCWQYEARKTVLVFVALNAATFLAVPMFMALALTGFSAAILLAYHHWLKSSIDADIKDD